jgi:DNA gyrase subunit B
MAKEKEEKKANYGASEITVLEGLEAVRRRPGMYIGTTGLDGLHHLIWEIFDNSRDEAMGGHADSIEVALLPNNRVRVVDNGRGIPVDIHPKTKLSALETVLTHSPCRRQIRRRRVQILWRAPRCGLVCS